jgi:RNA polymerase sigma factor (sigma-70 family)
VSATTVTTRAPARTFRSKRLLALAGDDRLVEQIRRGSEVAFEVAYERHGNGILAFCRHMLGSREEAEDAVQHTFAAAYSDLQREGERRIALKAWLYTIARNRCISVIRSRREHAAELHELPTAGLSEQVERRAELRELLSDVRELPEEQRAALLLSEAAGLSHAEVAQVLGCRPAAVKGIVFRARSGLIERRAARDTPCAEIREQLATLRGGALRRNALRHHLRRCPGCSAYREELRHQRRMLAVALPVTPTLGLKAGVLGAAGIGGGAAAGASGGALALGSAAVAKVAMVGALAGGTVVAGEVVIERATEPRAAQVAPAPDAPSRAPATPAMGRPPVETRGAHGRSVSAERRSARSRGNHRGNGNGNGNGNGKAKTNPAPAARARPGSRERGSAQGRRLGSGKKTEKSAGRARVKNAPPAKGPAPAAEPVSVPQQPVPKPEAKVAPPGQLKKAK